MVVHDKLSSALRTFATANPFSTLEESGRVLSTLLSNLAREDTPKFRRVNLTNAKIKAAVLGAAGACEVLIAAGFLAVEDGSALEMTGDGASARAAAASAALDEALVAAGGPFALRQRLAHEARCCCGGAPGEAGTVLTGGMDNLVKVWSTALPLQGAAEPLRVFVAHENARGASGVLALCSLPGGAVASAGRDGKVVVWDASDVAGGGGAGGAVPLAILTTHGEPPGKEVSNKQVVTCLAREGAVVGGALCSGGWDQTVRVWHPLPGGATPTPAALLHEQAVLAICVLPDGRLLSGAGDGTVGVWRRPVSSAVSSAGFVKEAECRVQTVVRGLAPYAGGFAQAR